MALGRQDEAYSEAQLRSVLRAGVVTLVAGLAGAGLCILLGVMGAGVDEGTGLLGGATGLAALWASFLFIRGWLRLR